VLGIIVIGGIIVLIAKCIKKNRNTGEAPSETKFFQGNDQGQDTRSDTDTDSCMDQFEQPFYSGVYSGIYDQRGTRMPVQPFEIYFQEQYMEADNDDDNDNDSDDDDGPRTIFHTITGKGADAVGPYTLSGKSVGNKVSITKKYYGAGDQITDIGHEVTLRLDKLGDTHIFEGEYYVNTDEVQEKGLYQIWPVGYNNNAAMQQQPQQQQQMYAASPPSPHVAAPTATFQVDEENQIPVATATAVPAQMMEEEEEEEFQTISLDHERR